MAGDRTEERRRRVRELWGKPDKAIAQILLEEGHRPESGTKPRTKAAKDAAAARALDSMRRNVWNDREWWRAKARKRATAPVTNEDVEVQRFEHIASLESDLEEIHELIDEADKPTAKAILMGEKRQTRALLAKARGIDELAPRESEGNEKQPPVVGVVLGTENISPEMKEELRQQGYKIP
jgi:hypothetical protein